MFLTAIAYLAFAANTRSLPPGKGKAIVQRNCAGCHALKVVTSKRASKEQWSTLVDQMVSRGADVSDDEIDTLVEYLAENFGPTKGPTTTRKNHVRTHVVNVNKATATELAGELNLTAKDAAAIVAYREQNGSFKAWTDLTKVPGVETAKIQNNKTRLAF
jgi:competence ComEA-like helix-hairpin-helix protein